MKIVFFPYPTLHLLHYIRYYIIHPPFNGLCLWLSGEEATGYWYYGGGNLDLEVNDVYGGSTRDEVLSGPDCGALKYFQTNLS